MFTLRGQFATAGNVSATNIAKWNGSEWSALGSGLAGTSMVAVASVVLDKVGRLYAAGSFNNAGGVAANNVARWNGSNWEALGLGVNGDYYPAVWGLALDGHGNLHVGGVILRQQAAVRRVA